MHTCHVLVATVSWARRPSMLTLRLSSGHLLFWRHRDVRASNGLSIALMAIGVLLGLVYFGTASWVWIISPTTLSVLLAFEYSGPDWWVWVNSSTTFGALKCTSWVGGTRGGTNLPFMTSRVSYSQTVSVFFSSRKIPVSIFKKIRHLKGQSLPLGFREAETRWWEAK